MDWDKEFTVPVDIHVYNIDMMDSKASWTKLYSFKEEYGLKDLAPKTIKAMLDRWYAFDETSKAQITKYAWHRYGDYKDLPENPRRSIDSMISANNAKFRCDM